MRNRVMIFLRQHLKKLQLCNSLQILLRTRLHTAERLPLNQYDKKKSFYILIN